MILAVGADAVPDVSVLAQYGPGGALAAVFATVSFYLFKALLKTLDLEREQNKELRTENRELDREMREKYIPGAMSMLAEAAKLAQVTAETTRVLQDRRGDR